MGRTWLTSARDRRVRYRKKKEACRTTPSRSHGLETAAATIAPSRPVGACVRSPTGFIPFASITCPAPPRVTATSTRRIVLGISEGLPDGVEQRRLDGPVGRRDRLVLVHPEDALPLEDRPLDRDRRPVRRRGTDL